MLKKLDIKIL